METKTANNVYRVLARKYRPQTFGDLIGQDPMVRTLTNAFNTGRIAQAWMLAGVRGVGKTTTARILARALNYKTENIDQPTFELSRVGEHCQAIMDGCHVDVTEMDAASHTGIDDIREIIEQVRYRPVSGRYKVYIIDEVHMLSNQAFNGLLKTLEEPPPHVKFIFATTEIRKVPITVLSRCQRFDLRRIDSGALMTHLKKIANLEGIIVDDASLAMITRASEGSARDCLSIFDQAIAHGAGRIEVDMVRAMLGLVDRARIIDLFEMLMHGQVASALREFRAQYDVGADPKMVLNDLADVNHLVTRLRFSPEVANDMSLSEDERIRGLELSKALSIRILSRTWQMLLKGISEVEIAPRPVQAAEMVLIRLAHAADLPTLDEALKALENSKPLASPTSIHGLRSDNDIDSPAGAAPIAPIASGATGASGAPGIPSKSGSTAIYCIGREEEAKFLPQEQPEWTPSKISNLPLSGLSDIVALADKHRDIQFKIMMKNYVRLVSIAPSRLEIALTDGAPKTLPSDIAQKLLMWTGVRWMVSLSRETSGQTIAETEAAQRDILVTDAHSDPDITAILDRFPGAKITDVRITADELQGNEENMFSISSSAEEDDQ